MLKNNFISFLFIIVLAFCFFGCEPDSDSDDSFSLNIQFTHLVDGEDISYGNDNLFYVNEAGNPYSVRRLLYVLSDVVLYFDDAPAMDIGFLFINTDDAPTLQYQIENLPGLCSGISFRLGFSSKNNIDNEYLNSPNNFHNAMVWPNLNGTNLAFQGGYHYMKLEGKYFDYYDYYEPDGTDTTLVTPVYAFYNTHTGPTNAEDFSILYPTFNFTPSSSISINMNVRNWYGSGNGLGLPLSSVYDMSYYGSGIMDNMEAQNILYQNGLNVFSVESE